MALFDISIEEISDTEITTNVVLEGIENTENCYEFEQELFNIGKTINVSIEQLETFESLQLSFENDDVDRQTYIVYKHRFNEIKNNLGVSTENISFEDINDVETIVLEEKKDNRNFLRRAWDKLVALWKSFIKKIKKFLNISGKEDKKVMEELKKSTGKTMAEWDELKELINNNKTFRFDFNVELSKKIRVGFGGYLEDNTDGKSLSIDYIKDALLVYKNDDIKGFVQQLSYIEDLISKYEDVNISTENLSLENALSTDVNYNYKKDNSHKKNVNKEEVQKDLNRLFDNFKKLSTKFKDGGNTTVYMSCGPRLNRFNVDMTKGNGIGSIRFNSHVARPVTKAGSIDEDLVHGINNIYTKHNYEALINTAMEYTGELNDNIKEITGIIEKSIKIEEPNILQKVLIKMENVMLINMLTLQKDNRFIRRTISYRNLFKEVRRMIKDHKE